MSRANFPRRIIKGDTDTIELQRQQKDGTPHNIAGRTYAAQIRPTADSTTVIATYVCTIVGDGSTGEVVCTLSATTTAALAEGVGVYDIQETTNGVVDTFIGGPVTIESDVTR